VLAPHHLRNRLPAAVTYQQATSGDNPLAPPLAQQQQQQQPGQQQQQQQASNEVAIDDVDFLDFEGALQASRYSGTASAATPSTALSSSSSSPQQQQQQQQQQRLSLLRQLGRPVDESMSDFPSAGLELVKHFNLDGIFLEKQVGYVTCLCYFTCYFVTVLLQHVKLYVGKVLACSW
jgi:hypothetical protein